MSYLIEEIKKNSEHIYIIYDNVQYKRYKLNFMYKPFINTLKFLFEGTEIICIEDGGNYKYDISKFNDNDTIIYIGDRGSLDFNTKKNKIYTILYWTEPIIGKHQYYDEVFLYSKYLFYNQERAHEEQKIKFIPLIKENTLHFMNYNHKQDNIKLCFMGTIKQRSRKKKRMFSNKIDLIYNLWNDKSYNNFIKNKVYIFLNISKKNTKALTFARVNKLLSHKCIIISEYFNKEDDELMKDIIYFTNLDQIWDKFNELASKSPEELVNIAENNYKKFTKIFARQNIKNLILEK